MNEYALIIIPIIIIAIIVFFAIYFNKKAIIARKLNKAEYKKLSNIKNGELVRFTGSIEYIEDPLIAPLSKRKCSYFYAQVEKNITVNKTTSWETIIRNEEISKIAIKDGDYCALIEDGFHKSHVVIDKKYESGFLNDASPQLESFLNQFEYESEDVFGFNETIRYREGILEKGEKIVVLGKGEWVEAEKYGLSDRFDKVLVLKSTDKDPVYFSDDPDLTNIKISKRRIKRYRKI